MPFGKTKTKHAKIFATALLFGMVLLPSESYATTDIDGFAELQDCVADSNQTECALSGDFEFSNSLTISRDLTISGDATLSRAVGYDGGLFSIAEGVNVTLQGITIDGGAPGWEKDLDPEHILFRYNAAGDRVYGGYNVNLADGDVLANAPVISNLGNLTINNSTFQNSYNQGSTASVITNSGSLTITDSTFQHNAARANTTILGANSAAISVTNSTFVNNNSGVGTTGSNGGAIQSNAGPLTVKDCYFENNSAVNDGGAINSLGGTLEISDSTFVRNSSGNDGSAIKLGRGVSASSQPSEDQSTGVLSNLTFSENINLSTYWPTGQTTPTGVVGSSNGQGVVAYFNDGYENLTIKDSSFSDDVTSWGIISLYSCDADVDSGLCVSPNYLVDGVEMHGETGSLISASASGNLTVKNSVLEPNNVSALSIRDMQDVTIEDTSIVGGIISVRVLNNETTCFKGVTIDEADVAFFVHDISEVEIDGLIVKNSNHDSYPNTYVGALYGVDSATVADVNYFSNNGKMRFSNIDDLVITDSAFCSTTEQSLEIGGASGETNAIITNTSVCRDSGDGPAMTVMNWGDDESVSRVVNLTLGNGFTIVDNVNNRSADDADSLSGGYGGGLYVEAWDDVYLTVEEGANINGNSASIAGNDIFLRAMSNGSTIYADVFGDYVEDNIDARATTETEPASRQYTVQSGNTLGLSRAIVAPDPGDDSENPETYDRAIASSVGVLALAGLGGFVALRNKRRG